MKKTALILAAAMATSLASAGSIVEQFNELEKGTLSGRLQTLSMYRDYDNGNNAHSTTLGLKLDYISPEMAGWIAGASYIGAGVLDSMDYDDVSNPGEALVGNGHVNILNEAYLKYNLTAVGFTNSAATVGRFVNHGEIFRADDFRQKPRAIEAIQLEVRDLHKTRLQAGHAWEMSNWIDAGNLWEFENFDNYGTDGITWGEAVNTCIENLEIALFDAYAWDVANLIGSRAKYTLTDETAVLGYYRWERDTGDNSGHDANVVGLSVEQKLGDIKLEGGYFGVSGDSLFFQETTTGINHALGASMMIYSGQFNGGADTFYLKAVTKLENTDTVLYGLYNYTLHDKDKANLRSAQELNIVVKQPVPKLDNLTVCFKGGIGSRDGVNDTGDTTATDARLFITYTF
jgi:hypothetical protein